MATARKEIKYFNLSYYLYEFEKFADALKLIIEEYYPQLPILLSVPNSYTIAAFFHTKDKYSTELLSIV